MEETISWKINWAPMTFSGLGNDQGSHLLLESTYLFDHGKGWLLPLSINNAKGSLHMDSVLEECVMANGLDELFCVPGWRLWYEVEILQLWQERGTQRVTVSEWFWLMPTKMASSLSRTQKENMDFDYQQGSAQFSPRICSELCISYGPASQSRVRGAPQCALNKGLVLFFSDNLYGVDGWLLSGCF